MIESFYFRNRIEIVERAYLVMSNKDLPSIINVADNCPYYRGLNIGELLLLIARGEHILNPFGIMHVETDRNKALPFALHDNNMPSQKRESLLEKLNQLGINTTFLGPGILLGLTEEVYLHPSLGDHGYTIRVPYSMKAIDIKTREALFDLLGIDVYNLPK